MPFSKQPNATFERYRYSSFINRFVKNPNIKYAYEEDVGEVEPDIRIFDQLWGGLRSNLSPAYYFEEYDEQELHPGLRHEENCFKIINSKRKRFKMDNKRAHYRFTEGNKNLGFVPLVYKPLNLPGKYSTFMWNFLNNYTKIDSSFSYEAKKALARIVQKIETSDIQTNSLMLSPLLINLKYLDAEVKHGFILAIAHLVKHQRNLKDVVLENTQMNRSEGLRVLLLLALGAGKTIRTLNLWHYFVNGTLPFTEPGQVFCEHDYFLYSREEDLRPSTPMRKELWDKVVIKSSLSDIPYEKCPEYFRISLSLFENLTVLWIHYAWLSANQGKSLCQIGSVKFKKLKVLNLLYNNYETVDAIQQKISRTAWKYVTNHVPELEVSLTLMAIYHYNKVRKILMDNIPLVEFNMIGGMIFKELKNYSPPWLDCIFRTLVYFYSGSLKRISIQNWHPHQLMDVSIGKLLTKIPSLEEFEYQGHIDKSDTINKICKYLIQHKTRLKRVHLIIQYDPCFPVPWDNFIHTVNERHRDYLASIGIDFVLKLYKC